MPLLTELKDFQRIRAINIARLTTLKSLTAAHIRQL
jgi:hypothetical protein